MILRVDLLRHGRAMPSDPAGDAGRVLAPEGIASIRELGARLARSGWRPERAFSSPFARARETAAIVLREAGVAIAADTMPELGPERDPAVVSIALVAELGGARHVLLVGHQPLLGLLAAYWTGVPAPLSPGEFVSVEFDSMPLPRAGRIAERIPPM